MKTLLFFLLCLPLIGLSQSDLTGIWRVTRTHFSKGPRYSNAIPIMIKIDQKAHLITLETTSDLGDKDTVVTEIVSYGVNPGITKTGKRKIVSFEKSETENEWLKKVEVFSREDENQIEFVNKEKYGVNQDGTILHLSRIFDAIKDSGNEDFIASGDFERVTPDQLAKELETGNGIAFTEGLTWNQIKTKAKEENKGILLDCYATWCAPCKAMDKYVYPLNIVGDAVNRDFISVKVQMDSTKNDPSHVKMLYSLARMLEKEYQIVYLPSYFFFSPNGQILHRGAGKYKALDFIDLIEDSKNPDKQVYTLLEKARNKRFKMAEYPAIINKFQFVQRAMAKEVFEVYYDEFLDKLSDKDLLRKENLELISQYSGAIKSSGKIFNLCRLQPKLVNSAKGDTAGTWAEYIVHSVIIREEITSSIKAASITGREPNWVNILKHISRKYGKDLATRLVLGERINLYWKNKNWSSLVPCIKPYLSKVDLRKISVEFVHYMAWFVFLHSSDTSLMHDAIGWIDTMIQRKSDEPLQMLLDTRACLLYKTGKREEARHILKKAIETYPSFKEYLKPRLDLMNQGGQVFNAK